MATTNSHTIGDDQIFFERDGVLSYNELGKDRDDLGAKVVFSVTKKNEIEIGFNYISYQGAKNYGREISLDISQVIDLKNFLESYLEKCFLKSVYTLIFLFEEHMNDNFVSKFFQEYEFIGYGKLNNSRLLKYQDNLFKDYTGVGYSEGESVVGKVFRISLYEKRLFDSHIDIGKFLLNEESSSLLSLGKSELITYNGLPISVTYFKLGYVHHRPLTSSEKLFFEKIYKDNNFPQVPKNLM